MKTKLSRKWWISIGVTVGLLALLGITGAAIAQNPGPGDSVPDASAPLVPGGGPSEPMAFSYQGRLMDGGVPASGNYDFIIDLYDNPTVGSPVASCANAGTGSLLNQPVQNGLFTFYLFCGGDNSSVFTGGERWIEVQVRLTGAVAYDTLPRQPISPTPYAFSLYPWAVISSTAYGGSFGKSVLNVYNNDTVTTGSAIYAKSASGSAVHGESADGNPFYGYTENGYAVYGYDGGVTQARGYGGYFYSANGVGVYGYSGANRTTNNEYAPGVYGRSANGVGVYGVSDSSVSWMPGVYGQGTNGYGVSGNSTSGDGVYGASTNQYGVHGYGWNNRGVYGESWSSIGVYGKDGGANPDDSYAVYAEGDARVTDDLSVADQLSVGGYATFSGGKTGFVVDIAQNDDAMPLQTGDVVVISGSGPAVVGEIPVVKVRRAAVGESSAVVGVVDRHYILQAKVQTASGIEKNESGVDKADVDIAPGEYLTIVTLGSYKAIKVDASYGPIQPGDLLVSSPNPGYAMRTDDPRPGTIIGKALGTLAEGKGVIQMLVTLQ